MRRIRYICNTYLILNSLKSVLHIVNSMKSMKSLKSLNSLTSDHNSVQHLVMSVKSVHYIVFTVHRNIHLPYTPLYTWHSIHHCIRGTVYIILAITIPYF
jgi:hypothetical protein